MGEGSVDDTQMWKVGASDFDAIAQGITGGPSTTALEIGCGIGRMLKAAGQKFGKVIGFDVSRLAVDKARQLIGSNATIELVTGSGVDLAPVESHSIDFVWSFAAIACMPVPVIAAYLAEIKRVLKPSGIVRLQVYLGEEMLVHEHDTLHLRSFTAENFKRAVAMAGFECDDCVEYDIGAASDGGELAIKNCIVTIKPTPTHVHPVAEVAKALLPRGESSEVAEVNPTNLEAWMALNYAEALVDEGEAAKARAAVDYVVANCQSATIDTRDILERVLAKTGASIVDSKRAPSPSYSLNDSFYGANISILKERFPAIAEYLDAQPADVDRITAKGTRDGAVIWSGVTCLDHAEKPKAAAEAWVKRSLQEVRFQKAQHIMVVGFGGGYHLEALIEKSKVPVSCCEKDIGAFKKAMRVRDLQPILSRLDQLIVGDTLSAASVPSGAELMVRPQSAVLDSRFVEEAKSKFYSKRGLADLHPKIAVLGPLQGGTLPTAQYTFNALQRLGQKARGIDVSGFNDGYMLFDKFIVGEPRRAGLRSQYVELVSNTLLETFNEKPIDILICMAQAPISARALTELRSRGVITVLWFVEDYLRFTYWREMARYYDFVFTIQKGECIERIRAAGAGEVHYVPTACDPSFHAPITLSEEDKKRWGSPISFVGAGYHNRQNMFASLSNYPFKIWGSEWPTGRPFDRLVQEESRRVAPEEYIKIFNATDININLHSSSERDGVDPSGDFVNPRTFELASCGAFQLCDNRSLLTECFEVGKEIVTFNNLDELKQLIHYYQDKPEERRAVSERARARVLKDHTYQRRLEQMLGIIYASKYEQLRQRESASPWSEMIRRAESDPELKERCLRAQTRGEEPALDGLVADIVTGQGRLSETEQKLLFMHHVRSQIIRMNREEAGLKK
jgi:spore maturation protein CgeB